VKHLLLVVVMYVPWSAEAMPLAQEPTETSGTALGDAKRESPKLGRLPDPTTDLTDGLLWAPRLLLFPAFVATEYLVRWPLGTAVTALERYRIIEWARYLTTWDQGNAGVLPVFRLESGTSPSVGLTGYWDDLVPKQLDLRVTGDLNFARNSTVDTSLRFRFFHGKLALRARFSIERRNDFVFFGQGPRTRSRHETRFFRKKVMGILRADAGPFLGAGGWVSGEVSSNDFGCGSDPKTDLCQNPRLLAVVNPNTGRFFTEGYQLFRIKGAAYWDTRKQRPAPGSGMRFELHGRLGQGLASVSEISFVRYGGEVSAFWDVVPGAQRVFGVRLLVEDTASLGDVPIPFAELVTLGGVETMRGFLHARFHGRSAVVATINYRYPIWSLIDGSLFFEVGNAFSKHLKNFKPNLMRGNFGVGIRTTKSRVVTFDLMLAFGTTSFERHNFRIDSTRVTFGTNWGF